MYALSSLMARQRRTLLVMTAVTLAGVIEQPHLTAQAAVIAIHDIQGAGARSPMEGQVVTTTGVVTGRKSNGVFLQAPDGAADADPRTSEGVFVFTSSTPPATLTVGTLVQVTGRVIEFVPAADPSSPPLTELAETPAFEVRGAGMTLPVPIELQPADLTPQGTHDQLERYEGMRVRVSTLTLVSPTLGSVAEASATATSNGVFYGVIGATARPFLEPGIDVRQPLPAGSPCCIPRFDGNPERLRVDSDGQPGAAAINAASGTVLRNVVGPLDYGFQSYTILPDPGTPPAVTAAPAFAPARVPSDAEFTVATVNLQRFFDTTDDPAVSDAVLTAAAFQNRLTKASLYIRRLMRYPHIIGVQEVENLSTLRALAAAINRDAREARELKPQYEAYLEEGNDPGGIDVGFLVDRARVEVIQVLQEGRGEQFRSPAGQLEWLHDRPPLVLRARSLFPADTESITVIVNHLRSLIDIESATSGPRVRAKRAEQAESLASLVSRRLSADRDQRLLVIGDFNAGEFNDGYVDLLGTIRGAPAPRDQVVVATRDLLDPDFENLVDQQPRADRYSYVLDGHAGTLDHMLVSPSLRRFVTSFLHVRGNADAPAVWRSDATRPERMSDHDPALVYISAR